MRTEKEIQDNLQQILEAEGIGRIDTYMQGYRNALLWVLSDNG